MNRSPWIENLFRPLVIGVMFGCIALSVADLVQLFLPAWNKTIVAVACVLAALEANYSHRLLRARFYSEAAGFRIAELALFFILLKVGSYIGDSWADVLADIQTWPHQPANIVDAEIAVTFALVILSWWASTQTARDLDRIGAPPERLRGQAPPRESIANRFFAGGAALLIITGITRIGPAALLDLHRPSVPGLILNVLVYFLLGLVLLGQVQFTILHRRWQAQKVKMAEGLSNHWARYSLALVALAALVAFLLPTGYTLGLLDTAGHVLTSILGSLWFIGQLLFFVISFPLLVLLYLLAGDRLPSPSLPPQLPDRLAPPESTAAPGWFQWLHSLLFWAVLLGVVFYIVRSYLRDHPEILQALTSLKVISVLLQFLTALWRRIVGLAEAIDERLPRRLSLRRARRGTPEGPLRFFRLGALSPRERTLYYYLSILRRAARQGFPRYRSQTPYEYDDALEPHLPYAQQEMMSLTQAFVEARYSPYPVDREQERQARTVWQKVKAALRALKQDEQRKTKDG
jgi:hypothetical protein